MSAGGSEIRLLQTQCEKTPAKVGSRRAMTGDAPR